MKKLVLLLSVLATSVTSFGGDVASVSLDAGYNNYYIVNGTARATDSAYVGFAAAKTLKYAEVYVAGTLLPNNGVDQSHWLLGADKSVDLFKGVAVRLDGTVQRHENGSTGIKNSTEFGTKLSIVNNFITPYVRGSYDLDLQQYGWAVGAERVQKLLFGFTATPAVEFGKWSDYQSVVAKATLARPIGAFVPYFEAAYVDGDFHTSNYTLTSHKFNGNLVYSGGIKYTF